MAERTGFTVSEAVDELHELQAAGVICELGGAWASWKRYRTAGGRPVLDDAWFRLVPGGEVYNAHGFGICAAASDLVDGVELAPSYGSWGQREGVQ